MRHSITAIALSAVVLLAACVEKETGTSQDGELSITRLQEGEWAIEDIGGRGVIDNSHATLLFGDNGQLSGNASCNRLIATYSVDGNKLTISSSGLTMMACPPALMDQERKLLDLLNATVTYHFDKSGALVLSSASGKVIIARR